MEKKEDSERDWKASNLHLKETVVDCFTLWLGGGGATQLPDKSRTFSLTLSYKCLALVWIISSQVFLV